MVPRRHCHAQLWKSEFTQTSSPCCAAGRCIIREQDFPAIPADVCDLLSHRTVQRYSRYVNGLLSFTAICTSPTRTAGGRGYYTLPFPSVVCLQGKSSNLIVPWCERGPAFYYVDSPDEDPRLAGRLSPSDRADLNARIALIRAWLERNHPLAKHLRSMHEVRLSRCLLLTLHSRA